MAAMDVPYRIDELLLCVLARIGLEETLILIDAARDDIEIELLRLARALIHEELQAFGIGIGQPFVDGETVAFGLRDLLAPLVEEELVIEAVGRQRAQRPADLIGELHRIDEVL